VKTRAGERFAFSESLLADRKPLLRKWSHLWRFPRVAEEVEPAARPAAQGRGRAPERTHKIILLRHVGIVPPGSGRQIPSRRYGNDGNRANMATDVISDDCQFHQGA
jgi:hypothetical protein